MQIKWLRNGLIATTAVSVAMMAVVSVWILLGKSVPAPAVEVSKIGQPASAIASPIARRETSSFEGLWSLTLQEPRQANRNEDPKSTVAQSGAGIGIRLVGTVIEPTQSLGLFRDGRGAFDLKGVGQPLELSPEGVEVQSIEPGLATVRFAGQAWTLGLAVSAPPNQIPRYGSNEPNSASVSESQYANGMTTADTADESLSNMEDLNSILNQANMNVYDTPPDTPPSMEVQP